MLNLCQISVIESKINYYFKNKKLLQQAFIRKSYAASNCCEDNEVLEFLGDRVLDYAVIKDMYERFGRFNNQNEFYSEKSVNELSKLDSELIKNSNLAEQIDHKGLKKYLQVSYKSERKNMKNKADLWEHDSVPYALGKLCNNIKPEDLSSDSEKIRKAKHDFYENFETVVQAESYNQYDKNSILISIENPVAKISGNPGLEKAGHIRTLSAKIIREAKPKKMNFIGKLSSLSSNKIVVELEL